MKIISFYLPQFHVIPENNEWWGNGFTEWVNTKKAKPLFEGHSQPKEPYNDNYYNLADASTLEWQVKLAKEYGLYGFCFYHYWFKGKLLLEKPILNYVQHKNIDFPFCTAWANEPWTRSWDGKSKEILMPQDYGDQSDWEEHFIYLLQLFKDERYIKVENKPLFIIYRPSSIEQCTDMLSYWNRRAVECGFKGIYFIEMLTSFDNRFVEGFNASIQFEPMYTIKHHIPKQEFIKRGARKVARNLLKKGSIEKVPRTLLDTINYDVVWQSILNRETIKRREKDFLGAFVNWDNTARKGNEGLILQDFTVEKFENYLSKQAKKSRELNNDFLFINAWNEWAEGTYLEPDKKNGFRYLEALHAATKK
ncbi:glycoside hydrolase family 99-like domain-containing protein [Neobacillus drentensis]|uniref:glycosyltransferase WbsX family protein n=1 Tax=Neobacillus drentensis TaxID=220684 RepID=UPI0030027BE6